MEVLAHDTRVNGWGPAVYMSYMSQNFRSKTSLIEFLRSHFHIYLLMCKRGHRPLMTADCAHDSSGLQLRLACLKTVDGDCAIQYDLDPALMSLVQFSDNVQILLWAIPATVFCMISLSWKLHHLHVLQ